MEPVVVDPGSQLLKAGFAQPDSDPSLVLRTAMTKEAAQDEFAGKSLDLSQLDVINPVQRGMVKDWDAMEDLWRYVLYSGLGWEPGSEGQILIAEALLTPKASRERMVQIMFENFNVSGLYAVEQAVLSLYAIGRITGVAVDIGHGKIDIAPVWEGTVQHNAVKRFELGGQELTSLFGMELRKAHPELNLDFATVEAMKERHAAVAEDHVAYSNYAEDCDTVEHTLPDGKVIYLGRERYAVGEALFQPSLLGIEEYGIAEQMLRSVSSCVPAENHRQLVENIVLCGGTSAMSGFESRFQKEAMLLGTPSIRPSLIKPPEYMPDNTLRYSAWMGGAILAKVVFPQNQHITKAEYDETGPTIVHRKCY
ncbi:actin-related protein 7, plant [Marchantia polymorpha subsp. ruderalis]|uniref:Actin-related protein 7 n=2 Tax=Marchantia polymorpha TaxID=3197 RepID=A0AAF6BKI7_MARPO|nr:hypothetical protein MARPO_0058s0062 [Marchantia polymorpha]BBN12521.1 hypothetical protein Mp_5g20820 [Marchantia polymorpha subsp. ruderalis]|eukprot:PTQ37276.1 hypothetical protein MARPO_0058s0062 [Marchantia polymorpha]